MWISDYILILGQINKERKYVFNPFQLVMNRGHYYLVGNHENYDDMSTLRVDRIAHITVLNERRKPLREIKGYQQQRTFNVSQYVKSIFICSVVNPLR